MQQSNATMWNAMNSQSCKLYAFHCNRVQAGRMANDCMDHDDMLLAFQQQGLRAYRQCLLSWCCVLHGTITQCKFAHGDQKWISCQTLTRPHVYKHEHARACLSRRALMMRLVLVALPQPSSTTTEPGAMWSIMLGMCWLSMLSSVL